MSNQIRSRRIVSSGNPPLYYLQSEGGGISLVDASTDKIKSLVAGGTVTITDNGTTVTISSTGDDIIVVANYSALPAASTVGGHFYWCSASQGTSWLPGSLGGTYYSAGLYYSNGTTWEFMDVPYQATQATVDTGTNTNQFVTPVTLTNATVITNKELLANKSTSVSTDQASNTKYPSVKAVYDWATGLFATISSLSNYQLLSGKDATGGYAGLTLFKINFKNAANTFTSFFTNTNTAARTYTFSDSDQNIAAQSGYGFSRYSGIYYGIIPISTSNSVSAGWGANTQYWVPFPLCDMDTISNMRIEVTTASAASTIRIGIYDDTGAFYPGALLFDSGDLDSSTTGFKVASSVGLSNLLGKKHVWLSFKCSSTAVALRYNNAMQLIPRGTAANFGYQYFKAGSSGALPNPAPASATLDNSNGCPIIECTL